MSDWMDSLMDLWINAWVDIITGLCMDKWIEGR
jgi:hypothetical protein